MPKCRICKNTFDPFISFGKMPIANGFLTPKEFEKEYFYELKVGFCNQCSMVQLVEQPDRNMMFHHNYAYFSSISSKMAAHFKDFAKLVMKNYITGKNSFVVEIGSNDGIMLRYFADSGIRHLGVEPSANVAKVAREKGIETLCAFFEESVAEQIEAEHGKADVVVAANVMCHIPYLDSVVKGLSKLLKPQGLFIFEDPYLGDIIKITSYDQIYDEHVFYFSVTSVQYLFNMHGMQVIDIMPQNVHGGSMRYIVARKGAFPVSDRVESQIQKEEKLGLHKKEIFDRFRFNVEQSRDDLMQALTNLKKQGRRVVGYGATSKSTTVINYCGITSDLVEFISDTTPTKQGKYSPGTHIPIKPYEAFSTKYPDVALLFAWNHGEEILAKEKQFTDAGGKFLVYVPEVKIFQ
jgi:methylation protein EvaC